MLSWPALSIAEPDRYQPETGPLHRLDQASEGDSRPQQAVPTANAYGRPRGSLISFGSPLPQPAWPKFGPVAKYGRCGLHLRPEQRPSQPTYEPCQRPANHALLRRDLPTASTTQTSSTHPPRPMPPLGIFIPTHLASELDMGVSIPAIRRSQSKRAEPSPYLLRRASGLPGKRINSKSATLEHERTAVDTPSFCSSHGSDLSTG